MKTISIISMVLFFAQMIFLSEAETEIKESYDLLDTVAIRESNGVWVHIENLSPEIEKKGLNKEQIQTAVELKLEKAGVVILTEEEYNVTPGSSCLSISVNSFKNIYSILLNYGIHVSLKQDVYLQTAVNVNNDVTRINATTWEKSVTGSTSSIPLIKDNIINIMDLFINDCLAIGTINKDKN